MARFLFQPDPIDGTKFKPIKIDIHKGVIKIVDDDSLRFPDEQQRTYYG